MDIGDFHIPLRIIFTIVLLALSVILILNRYAIYGAYLNSPGRKQFLKALPIVLPPLFSLVLSYWLKQTKPEYFLSGFLYVGLPFFVFYAIYQSILNWADDKVALDLKEEKRLRSEEADAYEAQLSKLRHVVTLEEYVQKLIKAKSKRFFDFYKVLLSKKGMKGDPSDVFSNITKPDEQLALMATLLHEYFAKTIVPSGYTSNVSVMAPDGDKLRFTYYKDAPLSIKKEMFCFGQSAAGKAWQKGKIIIVPDKQKELQDSNGKRLYEKGKRDFNDDAGSLICYPVFDFQLSNDHKGSLIYVINITSSKPNNFLIEDQAHYEKILSSIGERMILEHRLKKIRDEIEIKQ
jgi:hypothetical protein